MRHGVSRELRDQNKFEHIVQFAAAPPALRDSVAADMKLEGLPRETASSTATVGLAAQSLTFSGRKPRKRPQGRRGQITRASVNRGDEALGCTDSVSRVGQDRVREICSAA